MAKYMETLIGDQGAIYIELSDEVIASHSQGNVVKASPLLHEEISKKAQSAFNEALEQTRKMATEFSKKLKGLTDPPEEMEVSFGIKLDASISTIVAKAGTEAHFLVTFRWKSIGKNPASPLLELDRRL